MRYVLCIDTENEEFIIIIIIIFYLFCILFYLQVKRNIDLVYGGGSFGLMGLISQRVYDGGCHVLGYMHLKVLAFWSLLFTRDALIIYCKLGCYTYIGN